MYNNDDFIIQHDHISWISSFCISVCTETVFALCLAYIAYVSDDAQVHRAQELEGQKVRRNVSTPLDSTRWHLVHSGPDTSSSLTRWHVTIVTCPLVLSGPAFWYSMLSIVFSNLSTVIILFGHLRTTTTDVPCKNLVDVGGCWRPPMQQKVPTTVTVAIPRWFSITSVPLKGTRLAKVNDKFEESRRKSTSSLQKFTGLPKQTWLINDFRTSDSF